LVFFAILTAIFLLHAPLLRLPYFWDEAGYYVPAARDLLLSGSVIPHSTPSNAHPPLVMAYLAGCWKVCGFSPVVTRSAMLVFAAFSLLGVFRLAKRVANLEVAIAATACTALYPVFFAQSSMAHVDLAAAGLTIWGLDSYLAERWRGAALWFSLAVLAKETALLAPAALLVWLLLCPWAERIAKFRLGVEYRKWAAIASLVSPIAILIAWYAFHYSQTGYIFGNPEFFRYNVQATASPGRIVLAFLIRIWQTFGYMHMLVLTLLMAWAMTRPAIKDDDVERKRIDVRPQCIFGLLILAYATAMALVGGAVLARYMLTVVPLVIILAVSTLRRRTRAWPAFIVLTCVSFVTAWFLNPPYGFAPEDNLAYRDYVIMHKDAAAFLEARYPRARVLTAWPASDEISRTFLGYVTHPFQIVQVEDFTVEQVMGSAQERNRFDVALVFSTKYEPPHPLLAHWRAWDRIKARFFGFHHDLPAQVAAEILGGRIVFTESSAGQWVALIELERARDAQRNFNSSRHEVAGMRLDHQPNFPSLR
jgi:4-amino-4-deoxy-L-arabinose transferase-like glycosyltransferase